MTLIKAHSTPSGIVHILHFCGNDIQCKSITQARALRQMLSVGSVSVVNGCVCLSPKLRGAFNKEIVASKLSKPLTKSALSSEVLSVNDSITINFLDCIVVKNNEVLKLEVFSNINELISQLK